MSSTVSAKSTTRGPTLVVLGGTSKAASTSLYKALARVEGFACTAEKECRFFLPSHVPLPSRARFPEEKDAYLRLFEGLEKATYLLDGTPDYLHYPGSEENIHQYFPAARLLFVLRDPVDRLLSWYRYARQRGLIEGSLDFAGFISLQRDPREDPCAGTHLLALAHGRYATRVRAFQDRFGVENVGVFFYEDLRSNEREFFGAVAEFLRLPLASSSRAHVPRANLSRGVRSVELASMYDRLQRWMRYRLPGRRSLHDALRPLKRTADWVYWRLNASDVPAVDDPELLQRLRQDYRASVEELASLLNRRPPWPRWG